MRGAAMSRLIVPQGRGRCQRKAVEGQMIVRTGRYTRHFASQQAWRRNGLTQSSTNPGSDVRATQPQGESPQQQALAAIRTPLTPSQIIAKAKEASKRGRLPGFEERGDRGLFSVVAFASPLDRRLVVTDQPADAATLLRFKLVLRPLLPIVFIVIAVTTIWPGVWITESMLESYFPGSWIARYTWWWYIPLSALPLPWAGISMWRKSSAEALASAHEAIASIAKEVGGSIERP